MLRIATIGTSMITDDFIQVVNANDQAAFVGTLSRDADRGAAFTAERGGERNFTFFSVSGTSAPTSSIMRPLPTSTPSTSAAPMRSTTSRRSPVSPAASTLSSKSLFVPPRHRRSRSFAQPRRRAS